MKINYEFLDTMIFKLTQAFHSHIDQLYSFIDNFDRTKVDEVRKIRGLISVFDEFELSLKFLYSAFRGYLNLSYLSGERSHLIEKARDMKLAKQNFETQVLNVRSRLSKLSL